MSDINQKVISIGRSPDSDHIIIDPQNRISRKHAQLKKLKSGSYALLDLGSKNGTYVNGKMIPQNKWVEVGLKDKITLSDSYKLDISDIIPELNINDPDRTTILNRKEDQLYENGDKTELFVYRSKDRAITFDPDKTSLADMLQLDETPFKTIGRESTNNLVLNKKTISRSHCRIRMVAPIMIEIEDLGSTNGTYCDGVKLEPNRRYTFDSSVEVKLGKECTINLQKVFPGLHIQPKNVPKTAPVSSSSISAIQNSPISQTELKAFNDLEPIWKEYQLRQNRMASSMNSYMMGGAMVGGILSIALGGFGALAGAGITVLSRYLGTQKSNEIRNDFTYEEAFLQVYACPRCGESFQKKPWITIRDCFKCKLKFR
jgi:pSer/pThr/pTyr-binding forkhead associated (FHA) protein